MLRPSIPEEEDFPVVEPPVPNDESAPESDDDEEDGDDDSSQKPGKSKSSSPIKVGSKRSAPADLTDERPKKKTTNCIKKNTGLMAAYDYDSDLDGIVKDGVPYVCIDHPNRPQIYGPDPEGTITHNQVFKIAPEANV